MITSAISSAARLSLAPVKLVGQMAGALVRGLRGDGPRTSSSARRSAGPTRARRSRPQTQTKRATARSTKRAATRSTGKQQPKRAATRSSGKRQPKSTAAGASPKRQPSAARPKRTAAGTSAQAQPERADRTEPLGDVAIAREVESTIFRDVEADRDQVDVNVAGGVVRLRGEVPTPDLIQELEARAARVPQVRRVENLLRTPAPPPEPKPPAAEPAPPSPVGTPNLTGPAQAPGTPPAESAGTRAPRTGRWGDTAESPTGAPAGVPEPAGRPEAADSADQDEPGEAEPGRDRTH